MKRQSVLLLALSFSQFLVPQMAKAEPTLSLAEAWQKAQERLIPIKAQRESQDAAAFNKRSSTWWEDPVLEVSSGSRDISNVQTRLQTVSLRQRLPLGPDRDFEKRGAQGAAEIAAVRSTEVLKEQENKFVQGILDHQIARVELQHAEERLKRIAAIQAHLQKTGAYTPTNSLERTLIELRLRDIRQKKSEIELRLQLLENTFQDLGIRPQDVKISWIEANLLKTSLPAEATVSLAEKQLTILAQTKKHQSEISQWQPKVELLLSESREFGGPGEVNQALGVGVSLPLFSGLSPRKKISEKSYLEAELRLQGQRRQTALVREEITSKIQRLSRRLEELTSKDLERLEAGTPEFERALRRGAISILQFLDYEDKVHEQVELFYTHQKQAMDVLSQINMFQEKSLIEVVGAVK